jgi:hypothetical protein
MGRILVRVAGAIALGGIGILCVACARPLPGTYVGDAVESGTLKLSVAATGDTAVNERPAKALPKVTVTITARGEGVRVRFGECELDGVPSGPERVVVSGECPVAFAGFEGPMTLSGTAMFVGEALEVSVTGLAKNPTTMATYAWSYKGARQD